MRNAQGYAVLTHPENGTKEADSFQCAHCQRITLVRAKEDPASLGGHCCQCDELICSSCVGKGCTPFAKKLEEEERRYAFRRALG